MKRPRLGLRGKMIGASALMLGSVLFGVAYYDVGVDERVLAESRRTAESLAEAMQVSVQQLGASVRPGNDILRDFLLRSARAGVHRIRVLDAEKHILARTDAPQPMLIEEEGRPGRESPTWDLLVPIITGPNKLGYIELRMSMAPLKDLLSNLRFERALLLGFAFVFGVLLASLLATQISRPLSTLQVAARRIASGDLAVALPRASADETGALVRAFAEMIDGLKERDLLRRRVIEAERDALLGRLAAGIAHDVRNPLNYIALAVEHWMATAPSPDTERMGKQIKSEIARANRRIGELLRLGKPVEINPGPIDLAVILEDLRSAASTPQQPIQLSGVAAIGEVVWDCTVVGDILRNLVTNAQQATGGTGVIEVRAELLGAAQGDGRDGDVELCVEDRGPGLPPEILDRVFEPWFSTKAEGVGLGLALSRKAAQEHGGDLTASNREGGGARFTLRLPRRFGRAIGDTP